MKQSWYIVFNGEQMGPMPLDELQKYNLTPESMVWTEGLSEWIPAGRVPELHSLLYGESMPPKCPSGNGAFRQGYDEGYSQGYQQGVHPYGGKSKVTAGILAILLGGLGVQYFYLGKVGAGLLTILLDIVTCGVWSIITLIQGILMLTMSDEEFDSKFVFTDKFFPLF